jgi:hypothetical protein
VKPRAGVKLQENRMAWRVFISKTNKVRECRRNCMRNKIVIFSTFLYYYHYEITINYKAFCMYVCKKINTYTLFWYENERKAALLGLLMLRWRIIFKWMLNL